MKKEFFIADYTQDQLNAFVKKLADQSGYEYVVEKTLRDEVQFSVTKSWFEKDGRIYFELTTLGLRGKEWETRLTKAGHKISEWAKDILSKPDFDKNHRYEPGQTLKVVLLHGEEILKKTECNTHNLQAIARKDFGKQSVSELKGELSLLIREKFSNKDFQEMGLYYIIVLHQPIVDSAGWPCVLYSNGYDGESWVNASWGNPDSSWNDNGAFAFLQIISFN